MIPTVHLRRSTLEALAIATSTTGTLPKVGGALFADFCSLLPSRAAKSPPVIARGALNFLN
jgi:hypothetical protein